MWTVLLFHGSISGLCCFKVEHVDSVAVSRFNKWTVLFQGRACGQHCCFMVHIRWTLLQFQCAVSGLLRVHDRWTVTVSGCTVRCM